MAFPWHWRVPMLRPIPAGGPQAGSRGRRAARMGPQWSPRRRYVFYTTRERSNATNRVKNGPPLAENFTNFVPTNFFFSFCKHVGNYNSKPWETGFFVSQGGSWDSEYGRFFLEWYSNNLLRHADKLLTVTYQARTPCPYAPIYDPSIPPLLCIPLHSCFHDNRFDTKHDPFWTWKMFSDMLRKF